MLQDGVEIKSLNIDSQIVLRFATTTISSTLENSGSQAGWAVFRQKIPLPAYVTNFTLYATNLKLNNKEIFKPLNDINNI